MNVRERFEGLWESALKGAFQLLGWGMLGLSLLWLYASFWWYKRMLLNYQDKWVAGVAILILGLVVILIFKGNHWLAKAYRVFVQHKIALSVLDLLLQLALLLSVHMMIRSDAAVVFNGAIGDLDLESLSNYLSRNPNNLMLFLYERVFVHLFGKQAVWVLQGLNICYTHLAGYILYKGAKNFVHQRVADLVFVFYFFLILLTPKFVAMYSDILVLPLLAGQTYLILDYLQTGVLGRYGWKMAVLGGLTGLGLPFRPTVIILSVAFLAVMVLGRYWKKSLLCVAFFSLGFGLSFGTLKVYQTNQTEVPIKTEKGLAKNALTFINLGLTFSGTAQGDMKAGLRSYLPKETWKDYNNGLFDNTNQISEIERRLTAYTRESFTEHLLYKYKLTTGQGNLNWIYKEASREKTSYISPLATKMKKYRLVQFLRKYLLYSDQPTFQYYDYAIQSVWFLVPLGLVLFFWKMDLSDRSKWLALSLFGGLLFLMVFEGGKSRYLIQFLPQILLLSALGWSQWWERYRKSFKKGEQTCLK